MKQLVKTITKKDFSTFVNTLIKEGSFDIVGVQEKGKRYVFDTLLSGDDLRLDYDVTILPPKKYFLPQYETLLKFSLQKPFETKETLPDIPRIIIGVHPYDIIALEQTDRHYLDQQQDDFYKKRRENTLIIGVDIQRVSERSFAASMKTNTTESGFDLLLTDIGNSYAVTIGSEKGDKLLKKYATVRDASSTELNRIKTVRNAIVKKYKQRIKIDKENWSELLVANYDHAIWEEHSDVCMECSSCTMVCRTWDGCMLKDFTKVGSGEVFRDEIKERYRHRFFRKGNYLPERYGFVACVGCGRCGIACLPDIADPCNLINELAHFSSEKDTDRYFIKAESEVLEKGIIHVPRSATIKKITPFNELDSLFEIELDDKKPLGHKPGQFVEVSIFGYGEAPFGISTPPGNTPVFEIMVRQVGNVTKKLCALQPGDKVGIRGPLGNGFNVKSFEGKTLLFTSGGTGMVPMRSLINHVLNPTQRNKFKEVIILYGAKRPKEITFMDDVDRWKKIHDVQCELTVDRCEPTECWGGCTGLITTLFPKIQADKLDSKNTIAVVIGPPVMYKFVIKCLQTLGIPDDNIYVSLERRMKCGVAKCGHCQINGVYVCKEGPVFNYGSLKQLPEAF